MRIAPGEDGGLDSVRANLREVWEVYQTFCTHVIGQALDLEYARATRQLRDRDSTGRSMADAAIELYYDVRPATELLASWRDATTRPANERPDIILFDRAAKRAVILDVKFRVGPGGKAKSEDLQEMQSYLHSFGLSTGGIVYPGDGEACFHAAKGQTLVELPIRPQTDHRLLLERVRETVASMWSVPGFQ